MLDLFVSNHAAKVVIFSDIKEGNTFFNIYLTFVKESMFFWAKGILSRFKPFLFVGWKVISQYYMMALFGLKMPLNGIICMCVPYYIYG